MSEGREVVKSKMVDFDCVIFNVMTTLHAPFRY